MEQQFSFFNFSLRKVLASEPDAFKRAKIRIVLTLVIFSVFKALIVAAFAYEYEQYRQLIRAAVVILLFAGIVKWLLYKPSALTAISHVILTTAVLVIWTNFLFFINSLNIITIQLIVMTALASYYLIGGRKAAIYTSLAVIPVFYYLLSKYTPIWHLSFAQQELAEPGVDVSIALNFVTFIIVHYLYYRSFTENLKEREKLNKKLQINIAEVKALADSRSLFLSTMSHELRTPLNGVIGMAHLLKDTALEEQMDKLEVLEFSANNLLALVNDVLDYNKSELDKIQLETIPVNLPLLMRKINSDLMLKASEKGLSLILELDTLLENRSVITDPTRLIQIFYNLAGNAIKFTDEGTVKIGASVLEHNDEHMLVCFSISDTGIGIPEDRQAVIFEPFTQASSDTTRKFGGTGLGLAIVKRLVKLFGSSINLQSTPGKGSTFSFTIDFKLNKQIIDTIDTAKAELKDFEGFRVLIAEDNRINVLLLEKLLSKWGVKTTVAVNGQEAVNNMINSSFDLVLMDIHMPVMDGYDAARAIRKLSDPVKAKIPIIAITASVSHNLYKKIKDVGMQDYINKPFQPNQLFDKIKALYHVNYSKVSQ